MALLLAVPSPALAVSPGELPRCTGFTPAQQDGAVSTPWHAVLDGDGVVTGYQVTFRLGGRDVTVETGRRAFAVAPRDGRLLVAERRAGDTNLNLVDIPRGCIAWERLLPQLAYPAQQTGLPDRLRLAMVEPGSRTFAGTLVLDGLTGKTETLVEGACSGACQPGDADVPSAAFGPAVAPRPVPSFSGGPWPQGKTLHFRWGAAATPPSWARDPVRGAASDTDRSSGARGPRFVYREGAENAVHYAGSIPPFCGGIACAARHLPSGYWGIWLRAHGTDFAWGTLRWCQRSPLSGCFDIRRVALHEFGHVTGLDHPESAGFRLDAHETVMHAVSPSRPRAGAGRHAFGRCDVATLQELYDVSSNRTPISACNDVESRLRLSTSQATVEPGQEVKLWAVLRVADRRAYGALAGNPLNGRSVRLKYRRAGSDDDWAAAWMRSTFSSGRYELSISPMTTWEFKAVFASPDDEGLRYSRSQLVKVTVQR